MSANSQQANTWDIANRGLCRHIASQERYASLNTLANFASRISQNTEMGPLPLNAALDNWR